MKTTILTILVFTLISCDATTKEFIGTSWKVAELIEEGKTVRATNDVILTIKSATEFTLKLDKNNCFGTYEITGKNSIKLGNLGCTEMCCDSDFSMAVSNALYKISKMDLEKNRATLSGNNVKIKFDKYDASLNAKQQPKAKETGEFTKGEKIPTKETTNIGLIKNPNESQPQVGSSISNSDAITLYKSPCKGTCEEYTLVLYKDGTIVYNGKYNAEIQGQKTLKVDRSELDELFLKFEQSNFTNFGAKYDDETIMDIQNTYLTYKGKKIQIRYKLNAPNELQTLLKSVESAAKKVLAELKKK